MSFFRYLRDNIRFIALYFVLVSFFAAMAFLDARSRMEPGNAAYTGAVSFALFAGCVGADYFIRRRYIRRLDAFAHADGKAPVLPEPAEYKDERYAALITGLYAQCVDDIRRLGEEHRESRDFMAAWAHEAKTPVAAARLLLEAGLEQASAESLAAEIGRINENIEKILYYSRSDSFSRDYIIAEENLSRLARENVKKHAALFIRKNVKVSIAVPEGLTVHTDRKWLLFIMDQLLSNALKYTPENGRIAISARQGENETVLCYLDDGTGIAEEDIGRVFDKSFTGTPGREPGSAATGLGLYLAQKLARKLGHAITITSASGRGTAAEVHFPFIDDYYNLT